jgi:hypothetical protein
MILAAMTSLALAAHAQEEGGKPQATEEVPGTSIIGNKELPIGLDFVPWRPAAAGAVSEGPTQLLDEPLEPIDPEVFRRELELYQSTQR